MMQSILTEKYQNLLYIIKGFQDIAVAYSGGVDSTLVAHAACQAVGPEHVLILHAASSLLPRKTIQAAESLVDSQFSRLVRFKKIVVDPLQIEAFVKNDKERCYVCKTMIYKRLIEEMKHESIATLLDGTNCDDLLDYRPGLKAVRELGVKTPLVEAGFSKRDIREVSAHFNLSNADLPSNSCLATRLECDTLIQENLLRGVEEMEDHLESIGYRGCRVRPRGKTVLLEFSEVELKKCCKDAERIKLVTYFQGNGFETILLNLRGRG